jgi:hypothetical protein
MRRVEVILKGPFERGDSRGGGRFYGGDSKDYVEVSGGEDEVRSRGRSRGGSKGWADVNPVTKLERYCHLNCGSVIVWWCDSMGTREMTEGNEICSE